MKKDRQTIQKNEKSVNEIVTTNLNMKCFKCSYATCLVILRKTETGISYSNWNPWDKT
jgi:hypothetical protein